MGLIVNVNYVMGMEEKKDYYFDIIKYVKISDFPKELKQIIDGMMQ